MKIKIAGLFLLGILLVNYAFSHNPTGISMDVDFSKKQLLIAVSHPVGSPRSHYIQTIEVIPDKGKPIVKTFHFQKANTQRATVKIPKLDDVGTVVIKAYCNKGGFLSREFPIEKPKTKRGVN